MSSTIDAPVGAGSGVPASPPRENLYRAGDGNLELTRAEDAAAMPVLTGRFSVFNTFYEIRSAVEGHFLERVAPGAFKKTISEGIDQMRVLFQHGQDPQIGNKVLGPIQTLREDATGAYYEVPLLDTSYNRDLIPGLEAGLYGASFRFRVMQEQFVAKPKRSQHNPDGIPERTITEAQVREFGPVTWGASPTATAGLRSLTDEFLFGRFIADPDRLRELLEAAGIATPRVTTTVYSDGTKLADAIVDASAEFKGGAQIFQPDSSESTTGEDRASEPEPSEATTRSDSRDLFWYADTPQHLRSK